MKAAWLALGALLTIGVWLLAIAACRIAESLADREMRGEPVLSWRAEK